jgi:hypothetical protein
LFPVRPGVGHENTANGAVTPAADTENLPGMPRKRKVLRYIGNADQVPA